MDVRRGFGTLSHLRNDEIKGASGIAPPASWVASVPLYQAEFSSEVERLYAFGAVNRMLMVPFVGAGKS